MSTEDRYYQVEEIVGFKQVRGVSYYKVRWQGYGRDQDSWEPARNLVTCDSLIEEYHSRTDAVSKQRKTRTTSRQAAVGKTLVEVSSDEDPPTVRRSQRSRTPTRHFVTEAPTTTPQKQHTETPTTKKKKKTPRRKRRDIEEEEETDEEEFDVHRSEYELRSRALRKSPRKLDEVHYFNSELPQPRKPNQANGSSAAGDSATTSHSEALGATRAPPPPASSSRAVLSSDEEDGGGKGPASSVAPQISVYESRVKEKLSSLSSLTRQKVAEALTSLTGGHTENPAPSQSNSTAPPPPLASQPADPPAPPPSSAHVYETRSHATRPHPSEPFPSSFQPTLTVTRRMLHSTTTSKASPAPKRRPITPAPAESASGPEPSNKAPSTLPCPPSEEIPQWMKFGWEEAIFVLIIVGLTLFAYYCFYSDSC